METQESKYGQLLTTGEDKVTRAVSINNENPVYPNPGLFRLKSNACLVLTEPGGVQVCGPGVLCVRVRVTEYEQKGFAKNEVCSCQ